MLKMINNISCIKINVNKTILFTKILSCIFCHQFSYNLCQLDNVEYILCSSGCTFDCMKTDSKNSITTKASTFCYASVTLM